MLIFKIFFVLFDPGLAFVCSLLFYLIYHLLLAHLCKIGYAPCSWIIPNRGSEFERLLLLTVLWWLASSPLSYPVCEVCVVLVVFHSAAEALGFHLCRDADVDISLAVLPTTGQ